MKPGELERNLSRLVEVARIARERLVALERELGELRHSMERLAVPERGAADEDSEATGHRASTGSASASMGVARADAARTEGSPSGREVGSK